MEPIPLTCSKCGTTWKLVKAGSGPVMCPHCKTPMASVAPDSPTEPAVAPTAAALERPTEVASLQTPTIAPPPANVSDADDPGLKTGLNAPSQMPDVDKLVAADDPDGLMSDYDDQFDGRRRHGNPLLKTIIVLLILIFLVPIAVFVLLLAVCAVMFAIG